MAQGSPPRSLLLWLMISLPLIAITGPVGAAGATPGSQDGLKFYDKQVRPVLARRCFTCHSGRAAVPQGGLRLDHRGGWIRGGNSGPAVVPGKSGQSLLVKAVEGTHDDVKPMPPKGPRVSKQDIAALRKWIDEGAKAPAGEVADDKTQRSSHWSFQPVVRPAVPAVKDAAWPRNAIDRFVLARLEKQGVRPSAEADPVTLLRRLMTKQAWTQPHRSHAYQRLARRWKSHRTVTLAALAINLLWLLPLAAACLFWPTYSMPLLTAAYVPLLVAVLGAGAGSTDHV